LKKFLAWKLERRHEEDVFQTFYRFNRRAEIEQSASQAGLELESLQSTTPFGNLLPLGPLAVLEVFMIKLHTTPFLRQRGETFVATLRRQF
jgi:hypothetical protein